jgi:damage-control phosphatase, subfamily I
MKTEIECLPCFVRQSMQVASIVACPPSVQLHAVRKIAAMVATLDVHLSPPANAEEIYRTIAEVTGCDDPYGQLKTASNEQALKIIPALRREVLASATPAAVALRFAIAGNCIDYGAFADVNITKALDKSRNIPLAVDHTGLLEQRIASLDAGSTVLYLADNSGEIAFDALVLEYLYNRGFRVTVAVKDGPIINDALMEDALAVGLDRFSRIISNGSKCPGTVLNRCSVEFRHIFNSAGLVIAKGQGNFESLSEVDREIFFLLMLKCKVAGRHMAELLGMNAARLPGNGEMVVYCSTLKNCL